MNHEVYMWIHFFRIRKSHRSHWSWDRSAAPERYRADSPGPHLARAVWTAGGEARKRLEYNPGQILGGGDWNMNFIFPYIENNHPNWLIFFRGVQTTNQVDNDEWWLSINACKPNIIHLEKLRMVNTEAMKMVMTWRWFLAFGLPLYFTGLLVSDFALKDPRPL